ncbi:glycoside hydrolase family 9 protein [Flammeovirga agarivorans]|uniref:Endoglucanase n=1 Tax=Flammeovirga agarivorans TaxID=2726742 RepID=A0A7X8SJK8_9BACT|nr:glycoside hydrolase family 9 protein [Flammeovirga agarivorans]NLR91360.1 cellulase [Flammeovirga agarivorans]
MKSKHLIITVFVQLLFITNICAQEHLYLFNQVGYYPNAKKIITVKTNSPKKFKILSEDLSKVVLKGTTTDIGRWKYSEESYGMIDASSIKKEGKYIIELEGEQASYPFEIVENAGETSLLASIHAFYLHRCSSPILEKFDTKYARNGGHDDTKVLVHPSALRNGQDPSTTISAPKGWYDAGDYNKYIVNSGITTYSMLLAYEQYNTTLNQLDYSIPKEESTLPHYLDQIKWNLDWMMDMQDPVDGGVYHKLTNANFDGFVMPDHAQKNPRYVIQKTTAAALDFSAVMSVAARTLGKFNKDLKQQYTSAAVAAYQWALENNNIIYDQNKLNEQYSPKITTGAYDDKYLADEFNWAAVELYILTGEEKYYEKVDWKKGKYNQVQSWSNVSYLPVYSLLLHQKELKTLPKADLNYVENVVLKKANALIKEYEQSPLKVSMGQLESDFVWGSNSVASNQGMLLLNAYTISKNKKYLEATVALSDYILGRNALDLCFLTGFGKKYPMNPHHRLSSADGIKEPVPGFLIGGPQNNSNHDGCNYSSNLPATKYIDEECSYSTNEIAINWNASFVYMMSGINNYFNQKKK